MAKLTFKEKPLSGKLEIKGNEIYPIFDVANGRALLDMLFEQKEITESEWRQFQTMLLQSNLPSNIEETTHFKDYETGRFLDVMGKIIMDFILGDIGDARPICENRPEGEITEPEFRQCTMCNMCATIFLEKYVITRKLHSKNEAYALINILFINENISEAVYDKLLRQITESTIPEGTKV